MHKRLMTLLLSMFMLVCWTIPAYSAANITIVLQLQGGTGGTSEIVLQSETASLPEISPPARKGYFFQGFFSQPNGQGEQYYDENGQPAAGKTVTGNLYLYAEWQVQTYTIQYENMDGITAALPGLHTYGTTTAIPNPTKEGYTFFGWRVNGSAVSQQTLTLGRYDFVQDITLTAVWNKSLLVTRQYNTTENTIISDTDLKALFYLQVENAAEGITADDLNSEVVEIIMTASNVNEQAEGAAEVIALAQGDVMRLYDFSISKAVTKLNQAALTTGLKEIPASVQVDITLDATLANKTGYRVYRYHNGEAQALPLGPVQSPTASQEYFEISEDGQSLSIHTSRLSTYAVVANTKTISNENSGSQMDVQAKMMVSSSGAVYKVDIAWGEMKFYYSKDTVWNPINHSYDEQLKFEWQERLSFDGINNLVRIYNHSNADVLVGMYVINQQLSGVDMSILQTNTADGMQADQILLSKVPQEMAAAPTVSGYLRLSGTPDNWESLEIDTQNNGFKKIANIAITIAHLNSSLTPKG